MNQPKDSKDEQIDLDYIYEQNLLEFQRWLSSKMKSIDRPSSARQLKIVEIKPSIACKLNEKWHSKLPRISVSNIVRNSHYVCYAAQYNNRYYAVAIWSSPVAQNRFADGKKILELRRFAISKDAPRYTASRMLSVMVKKIKKKFPEIARLISYQDTETHRGTIYKASNWKAYSVTSFRSWTHSKRKRNPEQSTGMKVRWEYSLK